MVQVKHLSIPFERSPTHIEAWVQQHSKSYHEEELGLIRQAAILAQLAGEEHATNEGISCLQQGLEMAEVLLDLNVDAETIATAIVYPSVQNSDLSVEDVSEHLGDKVTKLIKGTEQMQAMHGLRPSAKQAHFTIDNIRKMLLAMVDDVRVVLIKLAERSTLLHNTALLSTPEIEQLARETMDIYAPLANRLGIGQIKWQLEDLSFRYLKPEEYKKISKALNSKRLDREEFIRSVIEKLSQSCKEMSISNAAIMGRAKHIYSIYRKMQRKNVDFNEIYDASAVRILVDSVEDCYKALSMVHSLWEPIAKEFDDYIASPKENGYQSIHTAVLGPNNKPVEVQIRTQQMHADAELGVAAHWKYKEGVKKQSSYEEKIAWLRQLMDWEKEVTGTDNKPTPLHSQIFDDQVYVFTPNGDVIDLPKGATPLDFAYRIHSELGHRCRGAKINGDIVPLTYQLKTGDRIDILAAKKGHPSLDWLNPHAGYLKTARAKAKVHQWFRIQHYDENLAEGHTILEKEQKRLGLKQLDYAKAASKLNFKTTNDMIAALGRGEIRLHSLLNLIQTESQLTATPKTDETEFHSELDKHKNKLKPTDINVQGVGNLLTYMANCCKPIPGDEIIGYITRGHGVAIHRKDCSNIIHTSDFQQTRLIAVTWEQKMNEKYPVDIIVNAYHRDHLIRDITQLLAAEKIPLHGINSTINKVEYTILIHLSIEIDSLAPLSRILSRLQQIPNVIEVKRQTQL
jgi:GTP pyrophosphokinase